MESFIIFLGKPIPIYGICWIVGILISAIIAIMVCSKHNIKKYDIIYSAVFSVLSGIAGSKILFILITLKTIIKLKIPFIAVLKGGFVFYG